jgi:hypothetical protein
MSYEQERNEQFARFYLEYEGKKIECVPENTEAYLYENPEFDHLFYITEETEDYKKGFRIWREMLGDRFDLVVKYMVDAGFDVESLDEPDECDMESFYISYPDKLQLPNYEIGPTLDKKIANWGKYLQAVEITIEDFNV